MRIVLFGATGNVGQRVVQEATTKLGPRRSLAHGPA